MYLHLQILFVEKFFWHAESVLEKNGKIRLPSILTFREFHPKIEPFNGKVACTPFLETYLLRLEQHFEEKAFYFFYR